MSKEFLERSLIGARPPGRPMDAAHPERVGRPRGVSATPATSSRRRPHCRVEEGQAGREVAASCPRDPGLSYAVADVEARIRRLLAVLIRGLLAQT
jgi:hypothetical protein